MNWERIITKLGEVESVQAGTDNDPFYHLSAIANGAVGTTVDVTMKRSEHVTMEEGNEAWLGCEVKVQIHCPQREGHINLAAEMAAKKALELVNDGLSLHGLPRAGDES